MNFIVFMLFLPMGIIRIENGYYKNRKKKKKEEDKNEKENILVLNNCATYCFTYV